MKKTILLFFVLFFLSGCSNILKNEYISRTIHIDIGPSSETYGAIQINNYSELRQALYDAVIETQTNILLTTPNYPNIDENMPLVIDDLMNCEPIFAYAVKDIDFSSLNTSGIYDLSVNITYKRAKYQIENIISVPTVSGLKESLAQQLLNFNNNITYEIGFYAPILCDVNDVIYDVLLENPVANINLKLWSYRVYPESGPNCIVEMSFNYNVSVTAIKNKLATLDIRTQIICDHLKDKDDPYILIYELCTYISKYIKLDEKSMKMLEEYGSIVDKGDSFNVYGAIVENSAMSDGYAAAFRHLCDKLGLESKIVKGTINGIDHSWNMIKLDGKWFHVDFTQNPRNDYFLMSDRMLYKTHIWDTSQYPTSANEEELSDTIAILITKLEQNKS